MELIPEQIAQKEFDLENPSTVKMDEIISMTESLRASESKTDLSSYLPKDFAPKSDLIFGKNAASHIKPTLETRNYNINEAYANTGSGEYLAKFDTFKAGRDNAEFAAANQTSGDKWANGIGKFFTKTGSAILGGTVGTVYGIGSAIEDGSFSALYDNDFSNTLADWDAKMNYKLPNYYSKQEQEKGLLGQAGTANFWADKVLGGVSFTVGAIVSEGIWAYATGGASMSSAGARWGSKALGFTKLAKGVNTYKNLIKAPLLNVYRAGNVAKTGAIALGRAGEVLNLARFTYTSAGYEAGVEALQYKREAEENYLDTFLDKNGRQPNAEELSKFQIDLENSANAVFGVNVAIVGSSNLITMGHIFDLKSPIKTGITGFLDKKLFGYGVKQTAGGTYEVLKATTKQKIARNILAYGKAPITEGLYEEGLQGVTNKTANKWIEHGYNPQAINETADLAGMVYESLGEQYGTKEGWVENGVGMIIGAIGGSVNAVSGQKQKAQELEFKASFAQEFKGNETLQSTFLQNRFVTSARMSGFANEAKKEEQAGNIVKAQIAKNGTIQSYLNGKNAMGEDVMDSVNEVEVALNSVTEDQFKEAGIAPNEIEDYKTEVVESYRNAAKDFKQNRKYAEYIIGKSKIAGVKDLGKGALEDAGIVNASNELLIQSLTWNLTAGEASNKLMNDIREQISTEAGTEQATTLETISRLKRQASNRKGQVTKAVTEHKTLSQERDKLTAQIAKLNYAPKETEGDKVKGAELAQTNIRLLDLNERIAQLDGEIQGFADELNKQDQYRLGVGQLDLSQNIGSREITTTDLFDLQDNVKKFENLIEGLKVSSPQRGQYLQDLVDEYSQAQESFEANQASALMLSSGKIKLESMNNWLSGQTKKNKSMDEITRDWLTDILQKYQQNKLNNTIEKSEVSIEEVPVEVIEDNSEIKPSTIVAQIVLEPKTDLEIYKERIENLLKKEFHSLAYMGENYDDFSQKKPTKEEIVEFREVDKDSERYEELRQKLSDWKLLDSAVDEENNSIAEIIDLIDQLEQEVQEEDTKDEITQDEAVKYVNDEIGSTSDVIDYDLAQNVRGHVKVKKVANSDNLRFSHLKIATVVDRLGGQPIVKLKGKLVENYNLDSLEIGTVVSTGGADFTIVSGGAIEVKQNVFNSLTQALNLYLVNTQDTNWSYKDVYEVKGESFVKKESDFVEAIEEEAIYDLDENSTVSFEIGNEDGWNQGLLKEYNRTKDKQKLKAQLKIYVIDNKGRRLSVLKSLREGSTNENFLRIRDRAVDLLIETPTAQKINIGISAPIKNVYLGSPQLILSDNQVVSAPFTEKAITQVIATGYMEDGETHTNREFPNGVDTTFVAKLAKQSKGKKVPFVIIKKGVHNIAYGITMVKTPSPKLELFDGILNSQLSPQDKISKINQEIQSNNIKADKLVFSDINNTDKLEVTREAFGKKQSFVSALELADPTYKKERLAQDATINIDLEDLDRSISDAKIRIDLDNTEFKTERDLKNNSLTELEDSLSILAQEVYNDFIQNASTKYINTKGDILEDVHYTDVFDATPITKATNNLEKLRNINTLKSAFTPSLPKIVKTALGADKIAEVKRMLAEYEFIKSQIAISDKDLKSGAEATKC